MDEYLDIYNENKLPTGKKFLRSQRDQLQLDDYHLIVCMYFVNEKGELLIQKRALTKLGWPGVWADTGGAVLSGETSEEGIIREVLEELGIQLDKKDLTLLVSQKVLDEINYFRDVYIVHQDIAIEAFVLDPEEVAEVKWATLSEIEEMIENHRFLMLKDSYFPLLKAYMINKNYLV